MSLFSKFFKKDNDNERPKPRNFLTLQVGDMISYELEDYQIVGKLTFNDRGFKWYEYQLESHDRTYWLNAEMDDELELSLYEKLKMKLKEPIPDQLTLEGIDYFLDEKGKARVHGEGRSTNVDGYEVNYYDFCNKDETKYLSVEVWGSDIEVSSGFEVSDYDFTIIAGS